MESFTTNIILAIYIILFSHDNSSLTNNKTFPSSTSSKKQIKSTSNREIPDSIKSLESILESLSIDSKPKVDESAEDMIFQEIVGLIYEETMTRIGYEFYETFTLLWESPELDQIDYNILISEKASPLWGCWITLSINDQIIWQTILSPRSTEVEDAVNEAILACQEYLTNFDEYQFQTIDMIGSGI